MQEDVGCQEGLGAIQCLTCNILLKISAALKVFQIQKASTCVCKYFIAGRLEALLFLTFCDDTSALLKALWVASMLQTVRLDPSSGLSLGFFLL